MPPCLIDHPVVPTFAADAHRWDFPVESARENKVVQCIVCKKMTVLLDQAAKLSTPLWIGEFQRRVNIEIPSFADCQETLPVSHHSLNGFDEVLHENDVGIGVA